MTNRTTKPADIRRDINRGLAWLSVAQSMVSALDVVANIIILALWIGPTELGVAALAITLFPVLDLAADMGLSAAIIQRDDHTEAKISTVFWLNTAMSLALAALLAFVGGPALSAFHGEPVAGLLLSAYGIKLVWQNVYFMPKALLRRELRFKEISIVRSVANVAEFAGKVGSAAAGVGIWCFVVGPFCRELVWGVGVQLCRPWRPRFVLRLREAMSWVAFGIKTSASQLLFHLYTNVDYQIVGAFFGTQATGYYRFAYDLVLEPCRMIANVVVQVAFPAYSRLKHDRAALIEQFVAFTRFNLVILLAFLGIVFVSTDDLIETFWGSTWLPAATAARVLCAVGVLRALSFVVPPLLEGMGRPGLSLAYNAVASIVLPLSFIAGAHVFGDDYSFLSVAIAWAIGYPIAFIVLVTLALVLLQMRAIDYLRRAAGIAVCAAIAVGAAAAVRGLTDSLAPSVRLAAATATMLGGFFVLLAYLQDISPRTIKRALRS